jgi:small subunit ribosomal protein S19
MARSLWKGPYCEVAVAKGPIWSRRSVILPQFLDARVRVHNGKTWIPLTIREDMIGHRFGEFAVTRRRPRHKKKSR